MRGARIETSTVNGRLHPWNHRESRSAITRLLSSRPPTKFGSFFRRMAACRTMTSRGLAAERIWSLRSAVRAAEEIARALGDQPAQLKYHEWFRKGQKTYIDKLWTGDYFG